MEYIENTQQIIFASATLEQNTKKADKETKYFCKFKEQITIEASNINYPKHNCTDFDW